MLGTKIEPVKPGPTAVVLANGGKNEESVSPLMRAGTVPILLRAILQAHKAGAGLIIVLVDSVARPKIQDNPLHTRRFPRRVEWVTIGLDASLSTALKDIAGQANGEHVLLVAGDRTYHSSLFRRAIDCSDERRGWR